MNKIYYGLSGTFKATTIKTELEKNPDIIPIWSMIKSWKYYETEIFTDMVPRNNLNFAILHLCLLKHNIKPNLKYIIERGVSDMAFYNGVGENDDWIRKAIIEENLITGQTEKILLVQEDRDFIENVILREKTRREIFHNASEFLEAQNRYLEFTIKYNDISQIIKINNAKNYIQNLGLVYDESQK